jgi:2-haloacid dehalogenase
MSSDPFKQFTTLTFDCYGTLIDWELGITQELSVWAKRHGLELSAEILLSTFSEFESTCQQEMPTVAYPGILEEVLRRIGARFDIPASREEARAFGGSVGGWPPFPDSREALQRLAGDRKLVILSNVDRDSFARSQDQLGVEFARVITAEDMGLYKPDPRAFRHLVDDLQRTLGVAADEILHVAQSLYHDIAPAKAEGLRTLWVNRRRGKSGWGATPSVDGGIQPDWEVGDLRQLATLLTPPGSGE